MAFSTQGSTHRPTVTGTRGMVACAHPLACMAGTRLLLQGGNAFDAAVGVAAALNVVEPYYSGIAGIGYALIYDANEEAVRVLDYCGHTPYEASLETIPDRAAMERGVKSALVPGACGGWLELHGRYGRLETSAVLAPAIDLAENGFAVTVRNSFLLDSCKPRVNEIGTRVMYPGGRTPLPGEILVQTELGRTFRRIVEAGAECFYRGDLAREMIQYVQAEGGVLGEQDLGDFEPAWVDPISIPYRGYDIFCPPPPCAGFQILETLNILEGYPLAEMGHHTEASLHLFIEAVKLANADRVEYAAAASHPISGLLSKAYAADRRGCIGAEAAFGRGEWYEASRHAEEVRPGRPQAWTKECTTHFDVVDAEGNAVAVTQSVGGGFGSGVMLGETGMFLNNFIYWMDRVPESPNCVGPHKKTDMCLSPLMVFKKGRLVSALGTPGSWGIEQTSVQFLTNFLDYEMNIQAAIEAPRFRMMEAGRKVMMEARIPKDVRDGLEQQGHVIDLLEPFAIVVGGAHGIAVDEGGRALMGGADPRRDGYVLGI